MHSITGYKKHLSHHLTKLKKASPMDEVYGVIAGATTYLTKHIKSE